MIHNNLLGLCSRSPLSKLMGGFAFRLSAPDGPATTMTERKAMPGTRYEVVQRCSEMLRAFTMPQSDKLKLEFQLVQIKRLLLKDHNLRSCRHRQCTLAAFENLEAMFASIPDTKLLGHTLDRVSQELEEMLVVLWALDKAYACYSGL
ncbi:hypothetical protein [Geomonas anaerohicana]|uniref:Uncharacterized protein n=1 Tax=Geomonas anaerohicana TaxID=2798583 RepID=A0ABS0YC75_9BACT|nr:hypothetical protein [Geomonas anaerohicana]MBJ6749934.1 hypothetical protein [Geomonas anaerohicana]